MIQVKDITYRYNTEPALDKLSLHVNKGESCAILGPSGCGKTTLLHSLAYLIEPEDGVILIQDKPLKDLRFSTGLVIQEDSLLPWKTVYDNIALGLKARKFSKQAIYSKVMAVLQEMELTSHINKYPTQLSGGQRQRVSIARTLVIDPDILLMDEPTSSLDAMTKETLQDMILSLQKESPRTMVFVTHSIEEAVFLGNKVMIMNNGKIQDTYNNSVFGTPNARSTTFFYNMVLKIRKSLQEKGNI